MQILNKMETREKGFVDISVLYIDFIYLFIIVITPLQRKL